MLEAFDALPVTRLRARGTNRNAACERLSRGARWGSCRRGTVLLVCPVEVGSGIGLSATSATEIPGRLHFFRAQREEPCATHPTPLASRVLIGRTRSADGAPQ